MAAPRRRFAGTGGLGAGKSIGSTKVGTVSLRSRFPEIVAQLPVRVDNALYYGAKVIAESAKEQAPEDTGRLKKSIKATRGGGRNRATVRAAWYWYLLEYGTVNMSAQPFMTQAAVAGRPEVEKAVALELKRL